MNMKEKKLYVCEICNTEYADKERAKACERKHHLISETTEFSAVYKPISVMPDGAPIKIHVKFENSDKWIEYKR